MNNPELQLGVIELCFFSFDHQSISRVALMRRAREVASGRYCLKFLKFAKVRNTSFSSLEHLLTEHSTQTELFPATTDTGLEAHIIKTSNSKGKRIQPLVWGKIIEYLKNSSPQQAQELDDLERIRRLSHRRYSSVGVNNLKQEKDATLLALKLFGADYDNILSSWFTQDEQTDVYLQGLEGYHKAREDDTIINDIFQSASKIAPEMQLKNLRSSIKGMISARRSTGQVITIVNANRNKIEDTTGADLVYYNHAYHSHVMVQYKMMDINISEKAEQEKVSSPRRSKPKTYKKEFYYRPDMGPEGKFTKQIERMKHLQSLASKNEDNADTLGYRLNNNCFFFKLCESFEFEPMSSELAQGLYLPLDYMEQLLQSPNTDGPHGGKRITYANAARHFSNSLFIDLMKEGLIGSSPKASNAIYEEIHNSLSEGRSLTLAWEGL